jgi:indole-3-glycerol phosphate synthase
MKNILDEIMASRKESVRHLKSKAPMQSLETMALYERECLSLKQSLLDVQLTGIIAEFKRASPSKGIINDKADLVDVIKGYESLGASAVSILTEPLFFKGNNDDILKIASSLEIPVLRKDFIFDEYQVAESKAIGADVILLIAACLSPAEVKRLAAFAKNIGMDVLLELHDESELDHICGETEIIGINNRNLKTFEVDIDRSLRMAEQIPADKIKVAESGIGSSGNISLFKQHGFKGFLIGENFMKQANPVQAFQQFVSELNNKQS